MRDAFFFQEGIYGNVGKNGRCWIEIGYSGWWIEIGWRIGVMDWKTNILDLKMVWRIRRWRIWIRDVARSVAMERW